MKNLLKLVTHPLAYLCFLTGCFYPEKGKQDYKEIAQLYDDSSAYVKVKGKSTKKVSKMRIGRLPFPFGLFDVDFADYPKLSPHHYNGAKEKLDGIIYMKDFGFIDLGHLRNTIDLTYDSYKKIRSTLEKKSSQVLLVGAEPTVYVLDLKYDSNWDEWKSRQRENKVNELSLVLAGKLGLVVASWHEVLTSFGYTATLFPEFQSSFSFDDQNSHVLGAYIATKAIEGMHVNGLDFNYNVTLKIQEVLAQFGASSKEETQRVHRSLENKWWAKNKILKRHLHIGYQNEGFYSLDVNGDGKRLKDWQTIVTPNLQWNLWIYPFTKHEDKILKAVGRTEAPLNYEQDGPALKKSILKILEAADNN